MPVAKGTLQVTNAGLAKLTGKTFIVEGVGTKNAVLVPLTGVDGKAITSGHKILLSKNVTIEGLAKTTAGKVGAGANVVKAGASGKAAVVTKVGAATAGLVEIEGAGTVVGSGQKVALGGLEISGTLQPGPTGTEVLFNGGEAKITVKTVAAKAKSAVVAKGAGAVTKGAGTAANHVVAGTATGTAGVSTGAIAGAGSTAGAATAGAGSAAGTTAAKAAAAGTLWKGTGLSLGLGLGLGAWGPVLLAGALAAAGVGVYSYMKRKKG